MKFAEAIDRPAQAIDLVAEECVIGRREAVGRGERASSESTRREAGRGPRLRAQRIADHGADVDVEVHQAMRRAFERLAEAAGQLGVVGLPDPLAGAEPGEVQVADGRSRTSAGPAESLRRGLAAAAGPDDLVDAAPLLGDARGVVAVEHQAVARLDRGRQVEADAAAVDRRDRPRKIPRFLAWSPRTRILWSLPSRKPWLNPRENESSISRTSRGENRPGGLPRRRRWPGGNGG